MGIGGIMTEQYDDNRRKHRRVLVSQPTRVELDGQEHKGRILNVSAGGAGIMLDVQLKDNSRVAVEIESVGMIPAKVVRQLNEGVAVKFELSEEKEQHFVDQIHKIVEYKKQEAIADSV
jgi:PilZ domain-containing protein